MKTHWSVSMFLIVFLCVGSRGFTENLIQNGSFDDPDYPLGGWVTDYGFTKNNQYVGNHKHVSVLPMDQGMPTVCRLHSTEDKGTKMETFPIPYEEGYRYRCTLKFKGPDYRIYFTGYRWKPGVKPYDNPDISDLRQVYKSRAETGKATGWKTVTLELPGKDLTSGAKAYLKQIKFVTLFVYVTRTGYLDDVVVTRQRDPSVRFD